MDIILCNLLRHNGPNGCIGSVHRVRIETTRNGDWYSSEIDNPPITSRVAVGATSPNGADSAKACTNFCSRDWLDLDSDVSVSAVTS